MNITIIGAGNIGMALAKGFSDILDKERITLTRRNLTYLEEMKGEGFNVTNNNQESIQHADLIFITVLPQQVNDVLNEIKPVLTSSKATVISCVTGITIADIRAKLGNQVQVARAMPNTALSIKQSMTCISFDEIGDEKRNYLLSLFNQVGRYLIIKEEMMTAATALCACGTAFFMRAIRSSSQGGIEMGFHADEALTLAVQTAKGAAMLLEQEDSHPETEIDKVTSPKGCTIAGLNEMEHKGFSSSLIKGLLTSYQKAGELYETKG